ncbi:gag, partial [Fusarium albosuccineum]
MEPEPAQQTNNEYEPAGQRRSKDWLAREAARQETRTRFERRARQLHMEIRKEVPRTRPTFTVRAYRADLALNPMQPEPVTHERDDPRIVPSHPQHSDISWISCKYHRCPEHLTEKRLNDCFPVRLNKPQSNPYLRKEMRGYQISGRFEALNIAELTFDPQLEEALETASRITEEEIERTKQQVEPRPNTRKEQIEDWIGNIQLDDEASTMTGTLTPEDTEDETAHDIQET